MGQNPGRILSGQSDHNIRFEDLRNFLQNVGFDERVSGSHHIMGGDGIRDISDLQPLPDGKAKAYQVRQVLGILKRHGITQVSDLWSCRRGRLRLARGYNMYKYEIHIHWSEEDEAFIAEVPELPGAMADGGTPEEAVANVRETIRPRIEYAREHGREVPAPQSEVASA